ncbi:MAG: CvpA family protein [Clostridia bacterium]|nr:CvpA family protein [Clostridia bacterium]
MVLDGIIILILLIAMIVGYRAGLAKVVSHLGSWLISLVLALAFSGPLKFYLVNKTEIDDDFRIKFVQALSDNSQENVPSLIQDQLTQAKVATATQLTQIAMSIFAFLIIFVGVKLIATAFKYLFSKKHAKGIIGFTDGILGMALGLVTGAIIVIALMAFVVPFAMGTYEGFTNFFDSISEGSVLMKYFYDYNLILLIIKALN